MRYKKIFSLFILVVVLLIIGMIIIFFFSMINLEKINVYLVNMVSIVIKKVLDI